MNGPERRKRVTLADIAQATGVSLAAVSLAIRGESGVSDETRVRVLETARRLGYRGVGRPAIRSEKRVTVGLVIKAPVGDAPEANRFYASVMAGVDEMCRMREISLLFAAMPVDEQYYPLEVPHLVTSRMCDGLIVVGAHFNRDSAAVLALGPPVILVDAFAEDLAFDSVGTDNIAGARAAVEHLIALGHREIVLVGTRLDSFPSILQRRRGYELAIAEGELRPHFVEVHHLTPEMAATAGAAYLEAHPEVTAAVCSNDDVAMALARAVQRDGTQVPERLSIVGFDDIDQARLTSPPLTTLAVDKLGMGRLAVALLLHRLAFPDAAVVQALVRPRLVERSSTRVAGSPTGARQAAGQPA